VRAGVIVAAVNHVQLCMSSVTCQ